MIDAAPKHIAGPVGIHLIAGLPPDPQGLPFLVYLPHVLRIGDVEYPEIATNVFDTGSAARRSRRCSATYGTARRPTGNKPRRFMFLAYSSVSQ